MYKIKYLDNNQFDITINKDNYSKKEIKILTKFLEKSRKKLSFLPSPDQTLVMILLQGLDFEDDYDGMYMFARNNYTFDEAIRDLKSFLKDYLKTQKQKMKLKEAVEIFDKLILSFGNEGEIRIWNIVKDSLGKTGSDYNIQEYFLSLFNPYVNHLEATGKNKNEKYQLVWDLIFEAIEKEKIG